MSLNQVTISLKNAIHNFYQIKSVSDKKIICVVKANAYGHGAVNFAKLYQKLGADFLAAFNAKEGELLRKNGVKIPIICLGFTPKEDFKKLLIFDLIQSVYSLEYAKMLDEFSKKHSMKIKCHLKLDTGMSRLGFNCDGEGLTLAKDVLKLKNLSIIGLYTHFSCADRLSETPFTFSQWQKFNSAKKELEQYFSASVFTHAQNTAAFFNYPKFQTDGERLGLSLYGYGASDNLKLKPVMSFDATVCQVKNSAENCRVGYGGEYVTNGRVKLAVLSAGYNDGLTANLKGAAVLLGDCLCPVVGRICMNMTIVDATQTKIKIGDKARFFGYDCALTAADLAKAENRSVYEVLCSVGNSNEKKYL